MNLTLFRRCVFRLSCVLALAGSVACPAAQMISVDRFGTNSGAVDVDELYVISGDGRYAAFSSRGSNYVADDTNGLSDIFVYDCVARTHVWNTCYSQAPAPTAGVTFDSKPIHFTPDGRFLLFASRATNHVPGYVYPDGQIHQLYVRDLLSNVTHLVTVSTNGTNGTLSGSNLANFRHRLSTDGRFVIFVSGASDLVAQADNYSNQDVFCRDLINQTTELITVTPDGTAALDIGTMTFAASTNGRYVAFTTQATNVVAGVTNGGLFRTYWRDRVAGSNVIVAITTNGEPAARDVTLRSLSSDGRYVAFTSFATNLTTDVIDDNGTHDLFIRDMFLGNTWTVTRATNGHTTGGRHQSARFSDNGEWLIFSAQTVDMAPGVEDFAPSDNIFIHHLPTRTNGLLSIAFNGHQSASHFVGESFARLSSSGRFTLFTTIATNLIPGTSNPAQRLYFRDQQAGTTRNAFHTGTFPTPPFNEARHVISADERWMFFLSHANFDPFVTKTNNSIELFRAPLFAPRLSAPSNYVVRAEGIAGATYVLESSSNLLQWHVVATNAADAKGEFTVADGPPASAGPRFYRLLWP